MTRSKRRFRDMSFLRIMRLISEAPGGIVAGFLTGEPRSLRFITRRFCVGVPRRVQYADQPEIDSGGCVTTNYDEATALALRTADELHRQSIRREEAELRIAQMSELRATLDSASGTLSSAADVARTSSTIFVCALETVQALAELEAATRQAEANAAQRINRVNKSAPIVEKTIDRVLDTVDRLLDQVLSVDVEACSDRQLESRDKLLETLNKMSDKAHESLLSFMMI